ncbi:MAG TPA: glycosyltransferase [Arcobacter sp.]|nr:glycosyltransferase [Arcobacter sp.]
MRINFVMSNTVSSGIFNAIIKEFKKYIPRDYELFVTEHPLDNVDIYHYHRPNLETELRCNSVVTVHHDLEDTDPWFDASQFIDMYHQANKIICLNNEQKKILLINEDLDNTIVIPHGINKNLFSNSERYVKPEEKFKIGIISKRYARRVKGEAYLHELYKRLDVNNVKFYFVGESRTIDAYEVHELGFEAEVYEYLPYNLFDEIYNEIDILLVPSLFEGGPANIPEALYTRTPILGREIAMIKDLLIEGVNGYFLSGNIEKDAILLNLLINDKNNIFKNLIDNINKNTPKVYSWKEVVEQHISVYKEVLKKEEIIDND